MNTKILKNLIPVIFLICYYLVYGLFLVDYFDGKISQNGMLLLYSGMFLALGHLATVGLIFLMNKK